MASAVKSKVAEETTMVQDVPVPVRSRSASGVSVPKVDLVVKEVMTVEDAEEELGDEDEEDEDEEGWDNASLLEAMLDEGEIIYDEGEPTCTDEEARRYKARLHAIGLEAFIEETLSSGLITARKLCTAFGARIPTWLDATTPDENFYKLLGLALVRELEKRQRLPHVTTIQHVANILKTARRIVIITGAGISTSLGIPDFRSKDSGFYSKLRAKGFSDPEEVFTLSTFDEGPQHFYDLAHDILPQHNIWTPTHQFIRLLQNKGKLLRNYTQNIDNVESHVGIAKENLIQCHGSWARASCRKCKYNCPGEDIFPAVRAQKIAYCPMCEARIIAERGKPQLKRKRSAHAGSGKPRKNRASDDDDEDDGQFDIPTPGVMKPDITFFGEALPDKFFDVLTTVDRDQVDLVLVMGTSMKVAPVSEIPAYLPAHVPQVFISRDPIHHINFDVTLLGECDLIVRELSRLSGWDDFATELEAMLKPFPGLATTEALRTGTKKIVVAPFEGGEETEWTVKLAG